MLTIRHYQPRGVKKEEVTIPLPVSLLQKIRAQAKEDRRSLNLAIVTALQEAYGQEEGQSLQEKQAI